MIWAFDANTYAEVNIGKTWDWHKKAYHLVWRQQSGKLCEWRLKVRRRASAIRIKVLEVAWLPKRKQRWLFLYNQPIWNWVSDNLDLHGAQRTYILYWNWLIQVNENKLCTCFIPLSWIISINRTPKNWFFLNMHSTAEDMKDTFISLLF
jgi:hypothetical protein